jgi:hypothetical protein
MHIFYLPPYTSHILQLLDVVLFQPFKHYHGKAVDYANYISCNDFNKLEFLIIINSIVRDWSRQGRIRTSGGLVEREVQV